jgi:translation initiation factor IF-2
LAKDLKVKGIKIKNTQLKEALAFDKPKLKPKMPKKTVEKELSKKSILKEQRPKKGVIQKKEEHEQQFVKKPEELEPIEVTPPIEIEEESPQQEPEQAEERVVVKPIGVTKEKEELDEEPFDKKKPSTSKRFKEVKPISGQRRNVFDSRARQGLLDEDERWRKKRPHKRRKLQADQQPLTRPKTLKLRLPITVKDLANDMKVKASEVITKLMMHGETKTINDYLEDETLIQLLGVDFDVEITIDTSEEERLRITDKTIEEEIKQTDPKELVTRPPVVAFMGHVDHGKTSLIDAIRKSNRVSQESGAITQHIGAFLCNTSHGKITILDTPGHEAFSSMRERGAHATDIAVLVIAGDEGMKDQTIEALNHAKRSNATIVVAINKCDKPDFNAENVYRQLTEHGLTPEAWQGSTLTINCSAVTKEGMEDLVEALGLQSEILELRANPNIRARGIVLESQMHKGLGSVATLLVQNGTLKLKDAVVLDTDWARIKTMQNEHGKHLDEAGPSIPVKITGLSNVPEAGSEFIVVENDKQAKDIALNRKMTQVKKPTHLLKTSFEKEVQKKIFNVILRADVQGSLEALTQALNKIKSDKVDLNIIAASIGEISESDVERAAIAKATIIGFHTRVESHAEPIAKEKKVHIYLSNVIYHIIDAVREFMRQTLDKLKEEEFAGKALVQQVFKSSHFGIIAGCIVTDGVMNKNNHTKLLRNDELIWEGQMDSLRKIKEDVKEVPKGQECGILLKNYKNVLAGDVIENYKIIYKEQEL